MPSLTFDEVIDLFDVKPEHVEIFRQALTHKSYLGEGHDVLCNQTMEFLGDAVLEMVISDYLYHQFPDKQEGFLTKARSSIVSGTSLSAAAKKIGFASALLMSTGEEMSGGRNRSSMLADAFEALIAAIYLTKGYNDARDFILKSLDDKLSSINEETFNYNYKSRLQEICQESFKATPSYVLISSEGYDHDKTFTAEVLLNNNPIGRGQGKSKKQAEQQAAQQALESAKLKK